ncbi:MAG TPA: right-handed parallel beta-helix repeat-containing protein [Bacteroidales bacterium]|nr:right-handed parallel beta-helix repeat-containing protein [Bacteroidales bacterium]
MKNLLLSKPGQRLSRILLLAFLGCILGFQAVKAEVNFTQTLTADFNKGVLNNVIVNSDNVYLQYAASDVGSWLTTTVLPQTLTGHRAVSWNDRYAYVIGGYNNLNCVNTVYYATISSGGIGSWTALNPLPVALRDPAVVIGTNTIYVMGGRDGSQVYNTIYYASINTDGTLGAWQTSAVTLPAALWGHTATYCMGYIYVVGGTSSLTENTALSSVWYTKVTALNTLTSWTAGTSLPAARNRHAAVTYNGKVFVIGGYNNTGTRAGTVYYATPAVGGSTGAWTSGASLPVGLSNHSAAVTNGVISVMAGDNGTTLLNSVYYSSAEVLSWNLSGNVLYDYTKDGSAFTGNGQVYYTGGQNLSGTPIINCRYANMVLTTNYSSHGVFVSNPFYELGAVRTIDSLAFVKAVTGGATVQVCYRTAGTDGIWGDWTALTATSPIVVGLNKQYLQYAVVLTGSGTNNATLNSLTLYTPGTQLSGDLSATTTFTKALSPYWATGDIWFNSGTHTFQAGATILFMAGTGLTVNQANMICNGTSVDSVKFMYYTSETGKWDGIYFTDQSDNGVSSQLYYTVIAGAGFGSNDANLFSQNTSEPLLSRCSIRWCEGTGVRLEAAHLNIQNSVIKSNTGNGLSCSNSNPTLLSSTISNNTNAGVYLSSTASIPNFSSGSCTISNNLYSIYYPSPNATFYQPNGSPIMTGNTYNGLCMEGGYIGSNQRWNAISYDYVLLGTVKIAQYAGASRLTIEPGNTIKGLPGVQLMVGECGSDGGELYALGTSDSVITFTSYNGLAGGWNGIYFTECSDNWGGQSQLDYCIIEKGNDYNYYSLNTAQPNLINHSIIRNSATDGARYSNATGSITNCQFLTNGRYPLYFMNPEANPIHTGNTFTGNTINFITLSGGTYSFDRTYNYEGVGYYILSSILMANYGSTCRLTLLPSVTFAFAPGTKLQLGSCGSYGGEIYAVGTSTNRITFRAYNTTAGGWEGIYFTPCNDNWGGVSKMEYCNIRHGNAQNILIEGSSQPSLNYCNVHLAVTNGIVLYQSNPSITNCAIYSNGSYPLKFNDWTCDPYLRGNSYTSNGMNYIAILPSGDYSSSRTLRFDNVPYHILGNINMAQYSGHSRLTIQPGVTLNFDPGTGLQLGISSSYGGDIWAEGKADSLITFKPYNNAVGGWNGITFTDWNDNWGGTSSLKYCIIEKGASYNISCTSSGQPSMSYCTIRNSASHGMILSSSSPSIQNCTFTQNAGYPLKYNNWQCNAYLKSNTYTSNTPNFIALSGGDYDANRTVYYDGAQYHVLGDIIMDLYGGHSRLTIQPGVTMNFDPGTGIQLGASSSYGGDLWAEGKVDSLITFRPYNGLPGGWDGINFTDWNDNWSGTSLMKYCLVEKGASYNLQVTTSAQPTIDHCTFTNSTGNGVVINGSANLTIRNSNFTYNAGHGLYFDNTATATLGHADTYTNNIYYNGGYELYNNSTSNINAAYNFWNTGDSTMVALNIYDKADNSAKGRVFFTPFAQVPSLYTTNTILGGTVKYADGAASVMKNVPMAIKTFANATIASTTSNTSGVYAFAPVASGSYKLSITPAAPVVPCNSTDALAILNHFAMIAPLNGMNLAAADVNVSHTVNGTDAMFVMKRFANLITTFPAGDYLWDIDTLIVNGSNATENIQMLCFGDVNASWLPPAKSAGSVGLAYDGSVLVESNTEFEMPVRLQTAAEVGAISLGFYYPQEYLEVTGARLANGVSGFSWSATDGLFRMGWCDMNALNIGDDEVVVILTMKTKDLSSMTSSIALNLFESSEFADASATPYPIVITIPLINSTLTGTGTGLSRTGLSVAPNPARESAKVSFSLAEPTKVRLTLLDLPGTVVMTLADRAFEAGERRVTLSTSALKSGIYFLKLEQLTSGQNRTELVKIVVSH